MDELEIEPEDFVPVDFDRERYIKAVHHAELANLAAFQFTPKAQKKLRTIILSMFARQKQEERMGTVYHLLKELLINAAKANFKKTAQEVENRDFSLAEFREMLTGNAEAFRELQEKSKELGLWVRIKALVDEDGVYFLVKNNLPLSKEAEQIIRRRLDRAMRYESLAEFFMDQTEESEGAGIGFAMIITALKGMGTSGKNLTVGVEHDITVARLYIPFQALANSPPA